MGRLLDIARAAAAAEEPHAPSESTKETKEAPAGPLISFLSYSQPPRGLGPTPPQDPQNPPKQHEDLARMPLAVFALSGLWAVVRSQVLGESVVFAADNALVPPVDLPIYRAAEMLELVRTQPTPDHLRLLHEVKRVFRGRVLSRLEAKR